MNQQPRLLFGSSAGITKVLDQCGRFARGREPVLLEGEPGTGKTALAEHIHRLSGRPGEFVKASASHIPVNLELAHLGGHARGAYTGADRDQPGLLETAHRGTFFLDELGNASGAVQEILLQVIEDGTIRRVRELRTRPLDVKIVFATNADLPAMIARGVFRRDLYDRLGFLKIHVPSLRDRRDEIPGLLRHYLQVEAAALGLEFEPALSAELLTWLYAAPWPGNVRELENLCKRLVRYADLGRPLGLADLPDDFAARSGPDRSSTDDELTQARRANEALQQVKGNKSAAARLLGISRTEFYRRLHGPEEARDAG